MKIKRLKNSDNAVVGIVAAFLIVGLIVAVLSVIQTQYVPKWMREKEADHMNVIADQFAQLNYAINTHVLNEKPNIPISTTITLGSKEMPYLMSSRAYGQLEILRDQFKFNIFKNGDNNYTINSSIIKYSSYNNYFIDQDYIFETGGVILDQETGNSMYVRPIFDISYNKVWNITIGFTIINIESIGGKDQSVHGYGPAPIQTEYESGDDVPIKTMDNIKYLNITSNYENSWYNFINRSLLRAGLNSKSAVKNYTISIDDANDKIIVEFKDNIIVNVEVFYYEIEAQIAPGWIETRQ